MPKISSSVHTRVENAMGLRKEILETALQATELLQKIKLYKKENEGKKRLITKFKQEIKIVKEAVHELEFKDLPKDMIRAPREEAPIPKTPTQVAEEVKEELEKPIEKSELEQELEDIKSQIEDIDI